MATVLEVRHGPVAVEIEGERSFSMTLRIRVSEASRKEGSHTDCTEYSGIEIQVPVLSKSRHTADKVKKNSVVRVEYSHVSGLSPQGVEVHENWWLTELVKR